MNNTTFTILLFIGVLINNSYAQNKSVSEDWKQQTTGLIEIGTTVNEPNEYVWYEETNISQGVSISILPAENVPIYIEQNNNYINFNTHISPTSATEFMINIDVSINESDYITIYNGSARQDIVWMNSSSNFPSISSYNLKVRITDTYGDIHHREYDIIVIPSSDKLFKDNFGNTLRLWTGNNPGNNKPIVFSEGFDAYDTNPQQMYFSAASDLMTCLLENGFDIYLLDNKYGTQDIRNNAAVFASAVNYIHEISGRIVIAGGVSMGGMIARYALAKAEGDGNPLPVSVFISIDAPQQGAVISKPLQDYKKIKQSGDAFAEHALNNDAAKQLLLYSTYDPEGSIHNNFYIELNSLNIDGYPHMTKNIGVSFSTDSPSPFSGEWFRIEWNVGPFNGEEKSFDLTPPEMVAGSFLPVDLTTTSPMILRAFHWLWNFIIQPWNYPVVTVTRLKDPAYIPYSSALDIVNGFSRFDVCIVPNQTSYHDVLPTEIINDIINEISFIDVYLQNQTVVSNTDFIGKTINAGKNVNSNLPSGNFVISSGTEVNFLATEEIKLSDGFTVESGANFRASIDDLYIFCNQREFSEDYDNDVHSFEKPITEATPIKSTNAKSTFINTGKAHESTVGIISIYPNPTSGKLNIIFSSQPESEVEMKIINTCGNASILNYRLSSQLITLDLSPYPKGIYLLTIKTMEQVFNEKIILK